MSIYHESKQNASNKELTNHLPSNFSGQLNEMNALTVISNAEEYTNQSEHNKNNSYAANGL